MNNANFAIKTKAGRDTFYQWDTGRQLIVEGFPAGTEIHYFRITMKEPITLVAFESEGEVLCDVPDEILQSGMSFKVYAYRADHEGGQTVYEQVLGVRPRPKPAGYIYTETQARTVEEAVAQALVKAEESGAFKGEPGKPGKDGHTPQKGVDYWTPTDKAELVAETLAALPDASEVGY